MAWQSWQSGGKRQRLFQLILVFEQLQRILKLLVVILVVHHLLVLKDRQHFVQPLAPQRLLILKLLGTDYLLGLFESGRWGGFFLLGRRSCGYIGLRGKRG